MTTTAATQSGKTGQQRTNRWHKREVRVLLTAKSYSASWKKLFNCLKSFSKECNRPARTKEAIRSKYRREIKRIKKQNESNIKR